MRFEINRKLYVNCTQMEWDIFRDKCSLEYDYMQNEEFLNNNEWSNRLYVQKMIDEKRLRGYTFMYDWNSIYSFEDYTKMFNNLFQNWMKKFNQYLYKYCYLNLWTMAHTDINWWLYEYPTLESIYKLLSYSQPWWKADTIKINNYLLDKRKQYESI